MPSEYRSAALTARILDSVPGTVFTLGDNAYESGSLTQFQDCYDLTWGRYRSRTRPAAGNHDYGSPGALGYFTYFGAAAGDKDKGYYSYDIGSWHIIVLNTNIDCLAVRCDADSPQVAWLKQDLAAHPAKCTAAYSHYPRFSTGFNRSEDKMVAIFRVLYDAGVELLLSGHAHNYERFAPQDPLGELDPKGVRQFIVGTGGYGLQPIGQQARNSELVNNSSFGVLKLTLFADSYDWQFLPAGGSSLADSGSGTCH